jgi:hypothetical protein
VSRIVIVILIYHHHKPIDLKTQTLDYFRFTVEMPDISFNLFISVLVNGYSNFIQRIYPLYFLIYLLPAIVISRF